MQIRSRDKNLNGYDQIFYGDTEEKYVQNIRTSISSSYKIELKHIKSFS